MYTYVLLIAIFIFFFGIVALVFVYMKTFNNKVVETTDRSEKLPFCRHSCSNPFKSSPTTICESLKKTKFDYSWTYSDIQEMLKSVETRTILEEINRTLSSKHKVVTLDDLMHCSPILKSSVPSN